MSNIGNKTPEIRFKGYTEDWEQRKLDKIADVRDGTHDSPKYQSSGHPFITSKNVKNGFINYDDVQYISDEDFEEINKRSKVDINDILMGMIGTIGNTALIRTKPDFAIKNVALIKDTKQVNYLYLYHFLYSPFVEKQLSASMDGGTQKFIALGNIRNLDILFPGAEEQRRLGQYFSNLDNLITLHQRKCDSLKKVKKSMLQKMFPKNGASVPEIRFAGFTGDWERRKLGEVAENTYGGGTPQTSVDSFWNGEIPWIQSQNIIENQLFDVVPQKYISEEAVLKSATKLVPKNSIAIVTRVGVGKLAFMPFSYCTSQDFLSLSGIRIDKKFAVYSIYKMLQKEKENVQGTSIKGITIEELLSKNIELPCNNAEQTKIGTYFQSLDNLITLHQRKVEKLKEIKKSMLQKMFV